MTTETKKNGRIAQIRQFASNTWHSERVVATTSRIKKSAVAVAKFVGRTAQRVWEWAIKPALTFIQKWFGPLLVGVVQGYFVLCIAMISTVLISPIPGSRDKTPLIWVMLRSGIFRPVFGW